ncbi:MAG: transposase [Deltaproteobacteria bacterium]|nr:transposase [Deltaproteobacteria bacterium]
MGQDGGQGRQGASPARPASTRRRENDQHLYKDRNVMERFFNTMTHFRSIATRYEKTVTSYLAIVHLAASLILLKYYVHTA